MSELEDRINSVLNDPEQMEKITKLAQSFMAGSSAESAAPGSPGGMPDLSSAGLDPAMLSRISRALSAGGQENRRERALLEAMMPYLSEKRRSKMDKALRIARLAGIARLAMDETGEGEHD